MAAKPQVDGAQYDDGEVMAAIDEVDGAERLVFADVSRDDAWVSTAADCGAELADWR